MFKDDDEEEENTFGVTRYPCMPSLVALQQMRNRLHLAFLGRKLMKWTALATGRELRRLAQELYEVYDGFAEDLRNAFILLARSRYFYPPLNGVVIEDIAKKAGVLVQQCGRTVSGVKIMQFEIFETEYPPYPHLGLEKGGQTILETKKAWLELLRRLILMMQLRAGFLMVELANRNANKKMNVLAKIVIPRTNVTMGYINNELEELAREEFFRLKKVLEIKRRMYGEKTGNKKKKEKIVVAEITSPGGLEKKYPVITWSTDQEKVDRVKVDQGKVDRVKVDQEKVDRVKVDQEMVDQVKADQENIVEKEDSEFNLDEISDDMKLLQDRHIMELIKQINEIVDVIKDMDVRGLVAASVDDFLKTAEELKTKLTSTSETKIEFIENELDDFRCVHPINENDIDLNKLCETCKENYQRRTKQAVVFADKLEEAPKLIESHKTIKSKQSSIHDNHTNESNAELGTFVTEVKEIIKIVKSKNEDGSISVQKKVINIQREIKTPVRDSQGPSQNNSTNPSRNISFHVSGTSSGKSDPHFDSKTVGVITVPGFDIKDQSPHPGPHIIAKHTKSEELNSFPPMSDPVERFCISSITLLSTDLDIAGAINNDIKDWKK